MNIEKFKETEIIATKGKKNPVFLICPTGFHVLQGLLPFLIHRLRARFRKPWGATDLAHLYHRCL